MTASTKEGRVRIGAGAGYSGDRIEPAVELAEHGALDYLVFECLAERTIALAQQARRGNPELGYDPLLDARMRAVLPAAVRNGVRIISNMGAANPLAAARKTASIAKDLGLSGLKIAAVSGDDVLDVVRQGTYRFEESGDSVADYDSKLVSANAYLGAAPIVEALQAGADIVLTGRAADPAFHGTADPRVRLGDGRLEHARSSDGGGTSARMRRTDLGRLFLRSRFQGRADARAPRLSDRRS